MGKLVRIYVKNIIRLHGVPSSNITDRNYKVASTDKKNNLTFRKHVKIICVRIQGEHGMYIRKIIWSMMEIK